MTFKKGYTPWNKDKRCPQISKALKGRFSGKKHHMWGKKHSQEARKKMSDALRGKKHPMWGKKKICSLETREKISNSLKGRFVGKKHPRFGKKNSSEHRKKISIATKGKRKSPATEFKKGHTPWHKGKTGVYSEEVREKMAQPVWDKNPNFKHGLSGIKSHFIRSGGKPICSICGIESKFGRGKGMILIHHKNENRFDNRFENLQAMCIGCHLIHHKVRERGVN